MIEVFKTNVQEVNESKKIIQKLLEHFPKNKINFDLSDCDKILRVEGGNIQPEEIVQLLNRNGFQCEILN